MKTAEPPPIRCKKKTNSESLQAISRQSLNQVSADAQAEHKPPKSAQTSPPALAPERSDPAANAWGPSLKPRRFFVLIEVFVEVPDSLEELLHQELSESSLSAQAIHLTALATLAAPKHPKHNFEKHALLIPDGNERHLL